MNPQTPRTATPAPEQQAKQEAAKKPSKDDLHEQRDAGQKEEAVVGTPRSPAQSLIDQERSDWEGMGQARHQPEEDKQAAAPTPGSNSLAGKGGNKKS